MDNLVSIVVPVYNADKYINRCIKSIINQTYKNIELILVNDGSSDNSLKICKEYEKNYKNIHVIDSINQGVSHARNLGIKYCHGDYLLFVDSDDYLDEKTIEKSVSSINYNNSDVVVFGWNIFNDHDDKILRKVLPLKKELFGQDFEMCSIIKTILTNYADFGGGYPWNKLWNLKVIKDEIPLFSSDLFFFEDLEWTIRMLKLVKKISFINEPLYYYNYRVNSVTRKNGIDNLKISNYFLSLKMINESLKDTIIEKWYKTKYYIELINTCIDCILKRNISLFINLYKYIELYKKDMIRNFKGNIKMTFRLIAINIFNIFLKLRKKK